jgi:hypothetical protein
VHLDGVRRRHKALRGANAEEDVLDRRIVDIEDRAATIADEMLVMIALARQLEVGVACAEGKLADEAGGGEAGEGAIDRGAGDRGAAGSHGEPDVVGAEMIGRGGEDLKHRDALGCRAEAFGAEGQAQRGG